LLKTPTIETWQKHEVEQGQLKIQMVITCQSVLALLINKEYKRFCKRGKHLNIDHTKTAIKNSLAQRLLTIWYHQEPITQHTLNDKGTQKYSFYWLTLINI